MYYCAENFDAVQKAIGIIYKNDYNSMQDNSFSTQLNDTLIQITSTNALYNFDPHDMWHDRLALVKARNLVNKPVDEGCAYLYGGSWGLSWPQILDSFKAQVLNKKNIDWVAAKEQPIYFTTNGFKNNADYIVNAFIIHKIEKEKGFAAVWQLLNAGPVAKGNATYFKILEQLTGIKKSHYNASINALLMDTIF
jgi:hypothetical protein